MEGLKRAFLETAVVSRPFQHLTPEAWAHLVGVAFLDIAAAASHRAVVEELSVEAEAAYLDTAVAVVVDHHRFEKTEACLGLAFAVVTHFVVVDETAVVVGMAQVHSAEAAGPDIVVGDHSAKEAYLASVVATGVRSDSVEAACQDTVASTEVHFDGLTSEALADTDELAKAHFDRST